MSTQTGSISFEATGGFNSYAKQNYATLSQIKGQFATCGTGAATAAKVATIVPADSGWTLYEGATVTVKFTSKNTAATPTLNVNNTGAKQIRDYNGDELTKEAREWLEGSAMALTYDGTYWRIQDSNLMERMYSAETAITQNANAISLSATKEEVENIQIGGRNLFRNTSTLSYEGNNNTAMILQDTTGWFRWNSGATIERTSDGLKCSLAGNSSSGFVIPLVRENILIPDQKYTISFNYRGTITDTGGIHLLCRSGGNVSLGSFMSFSVSETEWKYYKYTFTCADYGTKTLYALLIPYTIQDGKWLEIKDASAQLELGNKATDWTPAPEDIEAYTDKQVSAAKSEIKVTTDGITSEVSKMTSIRYLETGYQYALSNIKTYSTEGYSGTWSTKDRKNAKVGDTVYLQVKDTTRSCYVYIKATVTALSGTNGVTCISHGYEDVLPVDTIKSTINQSADSVKIQAKHVDIEGAAIFSSGGAYDKSTTAVKTETQWYSSTSATSKSGGSWGTTQPIVTAGRYIWQRELVTYANGNTAYKPSEAGVCTQGQTDLSAYSTTNKMNEAIDASLEMHDYTIDLSGSTYDTATWYPVVIQPTKSGGMTHLTMEFNDAGGTPSWSSHTTKHWAAAVDVTYKPSQWGWMGDSQSYIDMYAFGQLPSDLYPVTFSNVLSHSDRLVMFARGGAIYSVRINTTKTPVVYTETYNFDSAQSVSPTTTQPVNTSNFVKSRRDIQTDVAATTSRANSSALKSDAVSRTQRIYYRTNTALTNSITGPTVWISESDNKYNTTAPTTAITGWSTKPTPLAASTAANTSKYLYLYTCMQTQTVAQVANGGTQCSASTVLLDDTETIIDGGKIITGSVTANQIAANAVTADKIKAGAVIAGKIAAGSITADKLSIYDSNNYAQLNDGTATYWGFTADTTADGHWYTMNTIGRDRYISQILDCKGGETFRISGQISTSAKGNTSNGGTDSVYVGTAIGLYCYNDAGTSVGIVYSTRVTGTSAATATSFDDVVTISTSARRFRVFVQTNSFGNFSGTIKVRNIKVYKMTGGELIVDGAITADKINVNNLAAINSNLGTLTAGTIDASKVTVNNIDATKITVNKIQGSQINVSSINIGSLAGEIGGTNLLGNTGNPYVPTYACSAAENTFRTVAFYNTSASVVSLADFDGYSNKYVINDTTTGNRGIAWFTKTGEIASGEKYTFSCKVKSNVAVTVHMHTAWRNGSATATYTGWTSTPTIPGSIAAGEWTDLILTFTPATTAVLDYEFLIGLCFTGSSSGVKFEIAHAKLERGVKATDWTPAPEDVDSAIDDASKIASNYIHADSTGINIYDNSLTNANKYYLRQTAGGTYIYRNTYLKAKYEDTITLYGGSNTSGANPKVELTSTDFKMTDSGGTQRLLLNSSSGAIIGHPSKGRTQITDAGMTIYDANNKKRTQVDANGLHVYNTDGSTETGLFGAATARIGSTTGPAFYMNDSSLQAYYMNGTTRTKYFEVSPTSITYSGFVEQTITTATDFNTLKTTGTYHIKVSSNTNAPTTGHGVLTVEWNVGTPYQIWQPDSTTTAYYKRKWTSSDSTWTTWTKIDAVDAAKTASNYMKFDSTNGLIIAQSSPSTTAYPLVQITPSSGIFIKQSATSYSKITSSSMEIYVPVSSTATKVASFGTTATIGQTSTGRVEVTSTGVGLYNKNNKMKVSIGTGNSIFYGGEGTYPYIELGTTATSAINIRQSATSYTSITSSGLDIYTTVNSAATKIASFGTTATIGATNNAHFIMAADKLQAFSSTNTTQPYFEVSASGLKYGNNLGNTVETTTGAQNKVNTAINTMGNDNKVVNGAFINGVTNWSNWGSPTIRERVQLNGKWWMHCKTAATAYQGYTQNHYTSLGITVEPSTTYTIGITSRGSTASTVVCVGIHWFAPNSTSISSQSWLSFTPGTTAKREYQTVTVPSGIDHFNIMVGQNAATAQEFWITDITMTRGSATQEWSESSALSGIANNNAITAQSTATNAAKTATNYITNIDSNKGITIKPSDSSGNDYLQMNSTDIRFVRNNVDVMNLTDSTFRLGSASGYHTTVNTSGLHIWTGTESTATNEIASFGSTARIGPTNNSRFEINSNNLKAYSGTSSTPYFEVSSSTLKWGSYTAATTTAVTNAAKTASNYFTDITSGTAGVMVHPTSITTTGVRITDSIEILRSNKVMNKMDSEGNYLYDGTGKEIASFTKSGINIGKGRPKSPGVWSANDNVTIDFNGGWSRIGEKNIFGSNSVSVTYLTGINGVSIEYDSGDWTDQTGGTPTKLDSLVGDRTSRLMIGHSKTSSGGVTYSTIDDAANNTGISMEVGDNNYKVGFAMHTATYGKDSTGWFTARKPGISFYTDSRTGNDLTGQSRTGAIGRIYADGFGIAPVSLYDNPSNSFSGAIQLSEDASHFTFIELYCKDNDGRYCYTKAYKPNNKDVTVTQTLSYGGDFYIKSKSYRIAGTSINTTVTTGTYHTGEVNAAGSNSGSNTDVLTIIKVIGYR